MRLLASEATVAQLGVEHREVRAGINRCFSWRGSGQGVASAHSAKRSSRSLNAGRLGPSVLSVVSGPDVQVSIMFSDLVGFASMTEALEPEVLIEVRLASS